MCRNIRCDIFFCVMGFMGWGSCEPSTTTRRAAARVVTSGGGAHMPGAACLTSSPAGERVRRRIRRALTKARAARAALVAPTRLASGLGQQGSLLPTPTLTAIKASLLLTMGSFPRAGGDDSIAEVQGNNSMQIRS